MEFVTLAIEDLGNGVANQIVPGLPSTKRVKRNGGPGKPGRVFPGTNGLKIIHRESLAVFAVVIDFPDGLEHLIDREPLLRCLDLYVVAAKQFR